MQNLSATQISLSGVTHPSAPQASSAQSDREMPGAWPALWAMAAGFFMIMIDTTIVSVSIPAIMTAFGTDVSSVIWVSSAYLLTYAIPLLITGRLGDRYGPKKLYLIGLAVFTLSSLWCGLSPSIEHLIAARAVQGLGAAMMSPQTMAVITRTFPPTRRGSPMALWGATASVAGLSGPLLGGLLVDTLGWEWIFFVNLPIGVAAIVAVWKLVPDLETHRHRFDWVGVGLNAVGLSLIVFALQEGQPMGWPGWILAMIAAGVLVLGIFVWHQARTASEPLMPLQLYANQNFSAANVGIVVMGATVVAMSFPLMLHLQTARGLSPIQAALIQIPSAVISLALAPFVGKMTNTRPTRGFVVFGFVVFTLGLFVQAELMRAGVAVVWLMVPAFMIGLASAFIWGPLSVSANRDLPPRWAGAGSGVYNATRQLGSVLGSAAIATIIAWQLALNLPGAGGTPHSPEAGHVALPPLIAGPFSTAMRHSSYFPVLLAAVGIVAALFLTTPQFLREKQGAAGQS